MNTSWHSYPKVWALGHAAIKELFLEPVYAEEKIDGSQFSFGRFGDELKCRSKGQEISIDHPEKLFKEAVETAKSLYETMYPGWTYRCEYLQKTKHNVLAYDRIPEKHLIVFDVNTGEESYLDREAKANEAKRIGLECVPILASGTEFNLDVLNTLLDNTSILGGQKVEGVVFKNYTRFGQDKKALMGKYVSERFKEVHKAEWKDGNPTGHDIIQKAVLKFKTEARWDKAVIHLKEKGLLEGSPKDIGFLMKEVNQDTLSEVKEEMMEFLFQWAWPQVGRALGKGLPEWYKQKLAASQFETNELKNE